MKKTTAIIAVIAMLLLQSTVAMAFSVKAKFITTADGLFNNSIRYIYQDSKGFVWMVSSTGLTRYDGVSFKTITPDANSPITLADRRVTSIEEDRNGFLWVKMTANLVSCYDMRNDRFVDYTGCGDYKHTYRQLKIMGNGDVWLWGDEGVRRVVYADGTFSSEDFNAIGKRKVYYVHELGSERIVLANNGLYSWSNGRLTQCVKGGKFILATTIGKKTYLITDDGWIWRYAGAKTRRVARLEGVKTIDDVPGQLTLPNRWVFFTTNGGYTFNTQSETISRSPKELDLGRSLVTTDNKGDYLVNDKSGKAKYINHKTGKVVDMTLFDQHTHETVVQERYSIIHDSRGIVWITTYGCGLYAYNTKTGKLTHFTANDSRSSLIETNYLLTLAEDMAGNVWVGTWQAGVSQLRLSDDNIYSSAFSGIPIRTISTMGNTTLFGTTDGRLFKTDSRLGNHEEVDCQGENIYSMCRDRQGTLWLGSRKGGLRIGDKWYRHDPNNAESLGFDGVYAIMSDRKGRMWVGTFGGGLSLATPDGKGEYKFKSFFGDDYGTKRVRCLALDRNGYAWVGTSGGIIVFDPDKLIANPKNYYAYNWSNRKLDSDEIRSMMCDSRGNIWIAETGNGFAICQPQGDYADLKFHHYEVGDGLINGMVQAFAEDRQGRVWISTEYGLSCFNISSGSFRNFFFAPTMMGNNYSENSASVLADGRIAFGTNVGVGIVDPAKIGHKDRLPSVTFTNLKINGITPKPSDDDYPLSLSLPYAKEITLSHNQNTLEIYFSTLDFPITTQPLYSYQLEGYDSQWSTPSALNFAAYKNLAPGTYTLKVRTMGDGGEWSSHTGVLKIVIEPPFYATPWAYLIYLIVAAALAYVAIRTFRRINDLRMQVKVEEQLADYKLTFFTNVSHEFRTPLTLIQGALDKMKRSSANSRDRLSAMAMMDKSVGRMMRLVNELIEFRKAEKGKLSLALEETDVMALLKSYYTIFSDVADEKKITYTFNAQPKSLLIPIDREKLDKIVFNLLSNAFKFTPSGGSISLKAELSVAQQTITIAVADTGMGVASDKVNKLFTRFASLKASRDSMGIGLHLTHDLVTVHKGTIAYSPNSGGGSVFTVTLPATSIPYDEGDFIRTAIEPTTKPTVEEQPTIEEEKQEPIVPLNDCTILVIEDDNDVRRMLSEEISHYATVVAKADGTSGYDYARNNDVDLILCDVMMPGIDGFEVTRRLKSDFDTSHIPIVLLTALSADDNKLKGAQSGADAYVTKPFSTKLLLTQIFKIIEQREKLKEKFSKDTTAVRPLISINDKDKEFADKLTEVLNKNLANADFTIDEFAEEMSLGRTILFRKVKGVTGYSPKEYLRVMRMKRGAELLVGSDMNVSEVAYAVGLSDPFYFSKCFKQQFGVPPSEYKKSAE